MQTHKFRRHVKDIVSYSSLVLLFTLLYLMIFYHTKPFSNPSDRDFNVVPARVRVLIQVRCVGGLLTMLLFVDFL
jgi:hypothetical protein